MKYLKNKFCEIKSDSKNQPTEREFLKYYFEDCAKKNNHPLEYYEDPLIRKYRKRKSRKKDKDFPKSINTRFISIIFQSDLFHQHFVEYLENQLFFESLIEVPDKFYLIFTNYLQKDVTSAVNYFAKNKRCKLPWSFFEIAFAIEAFTNVITDVRKSQ